tara:strand:- start:2330 stop:2662 length:333 start_codon:yes stop_codon:yes gene_type:complete
MLVSLLFLNKAYITKSDKTKAKENYSFGKAVEAGGYTASKSFSYLLGLLILMLELFFIICNVNIVFKCTKPGSERIINMILAIIIPIPYMFGNILLNPCAKQTLQSNKLF